MNEVTLQPYTLEKCHEFWREYVADPDMMDTEYTYSPEWVEKYYHGKVQEPDRRFFAVCVGDKIIGEISLKHLDPEKGCATLSIHFSNDSYKNRGYGTEAERQIIRYAFDELRLNALYADCVHRNKRSQHVLEKVGFRYSREDGSKKYYVLRRDI